MNEIGQELLPPPLLIPGLFTEQWWVTRLLTSGAVCYPLVFTVCFAIDEKCGGERWVIKDMPGKILRTGTETRLLTNLVSHKPAYVIL
jgi:hypothetical protein